MATIGHVDVKPGERLPLAVDYAEKLPESASVATASAIDQADQSDATSAVIGTVDVAGDQVVIDLIGTTDGKNYLVTVATTLTTETPAYVLRDVFQMRVRA